jgi:hypothetical protein
LKRLRRKRRRKEKRRKEKGERRKEKGETERKHAPFYSAASPQQKGTFSSRKNNW